MVLADRARGASEAVRSIARAHVAQQAEHLLGKEEVTSSNLVMGSMLFRAKPADRRAANPGA
jgi:hypothetical protein